MAQHPVIAKDNVAVITGGADGIGLAAAQYYKSQGMNICLADIDPDKLQAAAESLGGALTVTADVSRLADVEAVRDKAIEQFGRVDILMNNAGVARHCDSWSGYEEWQQTLSVNLWGVINGVHAFAETMIAQGTPGMIINTGSKQGITTPPGNPAYNASKAGVKAVTEALQHNLRNTEGCQVTAHLLVPGFTYSGMVRQFLPEKPDSAWTCEQVVEYMVAALARGDFYIICPDNDATEEMDKKRMTWAMGDLVENRPALSRWHPDYEEAFATFMQS